MIREGKIMLISNGDATVIARSEQFRRFNQHQRDYPKLTFATKLSYDVFLIIKLILQMRKTSWTLFHPANIKGCYALNMHQCYTLLITRRNVTDTLWQDHKNM